MAKIDELEAKVIALEDAVNALQRKVDPPQVPAAQQQPLSAEHATILDQIAQLEALPARTADQDATLARLRTLEVALRRALQNRGGAEPE
jgi:hypothetical protein